MVFSSPCPMSTSPTSRSPTYVLARAAELGDKPALIDGPTGRTITYAELDGAIRVAGRRPGRARLRAGRVPRADGAQLPRVRRRLPRRRAGRRRDHHDQPDVHRTRGPPPARSTRRRPILVTVPMFLEIATRGAEGTAVKEIFVIGEADGCDAGRRRCSAHPLAEQVPVDLDDVVVLPYSSGTTGLAKGVMLTHRNLVANIAQTLGTADIREDEAFVAVLPFFHIYGMQVLMNTGLRAGATIVTMPRFDLEQFLRCTRSTASRARSSRRRSSSRWPSTRSSTTTTCPRCGSLLRRRAAVGRARDRGGAAARLRGRAGLRHDRAVAGVATLRPPGMFKPGLGRRHRAEHRDRRSSIRRPGKRSASTRTARCGCAARR